MQWQRIAIGESFNSIMVVQCIMSFDLITIVAKLLSAKLSYLVRCFSKML